MKKKRTFAQPFAAMKQFISKIDKQIIPTLPQAVFSGEIQVYQADKVPQEVIDYIKSQKMIGFDTETRPSFQKGVHYDLALVQIACEKECFLIRLTGCRFPEFVREVFCDPDILKIGLSCRDDFSRMRSAIAKKKSRSLRNRLFRSRKAKDSAVDESVFAPQNFVEIQDYVKPFGIEDMSLQKIYAIVFNKRISKTQQLSNWEAKELSPAQQQYAALDAWAVKEIYLELLSLKTQEPAAEQPAQEKKQEPTQA